MLTPDTVEFQSVMVSWAFLILSDQTTRSIFGINYGVHIAWPSRAFAIDCGDFTQFGVS